MTADRVDEGRLVLRGVGFEVLHEPESGARILRRLTGSGWRRAAMLFALMAAGWGIASAWNTLALIGAGGAGIAAALFWQIGRKATLERVTWFPDGRIQVLRVEGFDSRLIDLDPGLDPRTRVETRAGGAGSHAHARVDIDVADDARELRALSVFTTVGDAARLESLLWE